MGDTLLVHGSSSGGIAFPQGPCTICFASMITATISTLTPTLEAALPFLVCLGLEGARYAAFGKDLVCALLITLPDWEAYIGKMERADAAAGGVAQAPGRLEKWMPLLGVGSDAFKRDVLAHCGDLLIADSQYERSIPYYHISQVWGEGGGVWLCLAGYLGAAATSSPPHVLIPNRPMCPSSIGTLTPTAHAEL
jgi:hypothetical protein